MPHRKRRKLSPVSDLSDSDAGVNRVVANGNESDSTSSSNAEAPVTQPGPETPSKKPRGPGRPKGSGKKTQKPAKEDTPPRALPPHEKYFFDNRLGAHKTSTHNLSSTALLSHEDYFEALKDHEEPHKAEINYLHEVHSQNFEQWWFELQEGFSVCLHGWGSKRKLVREFADFVLGEVIDAPKVVVVNGFSNGVTIKDVLTTVASAIIAPSSGTYNLPAQPADALNEITTALSTELAPQILLLVNSMDNPALRRPAAQAIFAQLAAHPSIAVLATCDTPNFPLLWDVRARAQFNWAFHDATTFAAFSTAEVPVVDAVNALLGRTGRKVQGREGAVFVLRSLTESARRLFALLLAEVLEAGDAAPGAVGSIEYRGLYRKAVQSLISTSEIQFRQLLKEFYDHEMLVNERDSTGTEYLGVPFRREECESILEELALEE